VLSGRRAGAALVLVLAMAVAGCSTAEQAAERATEEVAQVAQDALLRSVLAAGWDCGVTYADQDVRADGSLAFTEEAWTLTRDGEVVDEGVWSFTDATLTVSSTVAAEAGPFAGYDLVISGIPAQLPEGGTVQVAVEEIKNDRARASGARVADDYQGLVRWDGGSRATIDLAGPTPRSIECVRP
jgi:hypothetical protein